LALSIKDSIEVVLWQGSLEREGDCLECVDNSTAVGALIGDTFILIHFTHCTSQWLEGELLYQYGPQDRLLEGLQRRLVKADSYTRSAFAFAVPESKVDQAFLNALASVRRH
jgi:hypothetical protein